MAAPGPVGGRHVVERGPYGGRIEWSQPSTGGSPITKYQWQLRRSNQSVTRTGTIVSDSSTDGIPGNRSASFSGLKPYTQYQFWCRAYNGQWGPWQDEATTWGGLPYKTDAVAPVLRSGRMYSASRTTAMFGNFAIESTGGQSPTQVRVQYNTSADTSGATVVTATTWTDVQANDLLPDTQYFFRVAGKNSAGWGPYTDWAPFSTALVAPDRPQAPSVSEVTSTTATVDIVVPAPNGSSPGFNYVVIVPEADPFSSPVKAIYLQDDTTQYLVEGLEPGTKYWVYFRKFADPNDSGWSDPGIIQTIGETGTLLPTVNVAGTYYPFVMWTNDSGTWRRVLLNVDVSGTWKKQVI